MTDKELQEVKNIILKKQKLKRLRNRILELEEDSKVKEYIAAVNSLNVEEKDNDTIVIDRNQSNNLLFEYGRFFVKIDGFDMDVTLYRDLETTDYFYYTPYYVYKKIYGIYIKRFSDEKRFESKNDEFNQLREYFFEQLLNKPQAEVVYEMLNDNKQLVKGRKNELLF